MFIDTPGLVIQISFRDPMSLSGQNKYGTEDNLRPIFVLDGSHDYKSAASKSRVKPSDGWIQVLGAFTAPTKGLMCWK